MFFNVASYMRAPGSLGILRNLLFTSCPLSFLLVRIIQRDETQGCKCNTRMPSLERQVLQQACGEREARLHFIPFTYANAYKHMGACLELVWGDLLRTCKKYHGDSFAAQVFTLFRNGICSFC